MKWFKQSKEKEETSPKEVPKQNEEIKLEVEQFHEEPVDDSQKQNELEELDNEYPFEIDDDDELDDSDEAFIKRWYPE